VEVLTAHEDGTARLPDSLLLDRTTVLGYVLFSQDKDLLGEASRRQQAGVEFSGLIYAHQLTSFGLCVRDLELFAKVYEASEFLNRVDYVPI
jgi:hypothetical protein